MAGMYAICEVSKISSLGALAERYRHDFRERGVANADPGRECLNEVLLDPGMSYDRAFIERRDSLPYYEDHQFRKNGVMAYDIILTFSHGADSGPGFDMEEWKKANMEWLRETFNSRSEGTYGDNVLSVALHMDEATPHIHAIVVPVDDKGKINASYYTGDRQKYIHMQDTYADRMKGFGLERGGRMSELEHKKVRHMYAEPAKAASSLSPLRRGEGEPMASFEARAHRVMLEEADAHIKEREGIEAGISGVKAAYRADAEIDPEIARLEKENKKLRHEYEGMVREFGSPGWIKEAGRAMQDIKEAAASYPDPGRYRRMVEAMASMSAWHGGGGRRGRKKKERDAELEAGHGSPASV